MTDNTKTNIKINKTITENAVSVIVDDPIDKFNSTVYCESVCEYMSLNSVKIGRTNKEIASVKRVAGDPYMGSRVKNCRCIQSILKPGKYLKDRCTHNHQNNKLGS